MLEEAQVHRQQDRCLPLSFGLIAQLREEAREIDARGAGLATGVAQNTGVWQTFPGSEPNQRHAFVRRAAAVASPSTRVRLSL